MSDFLDDLDLDTKESRQGGFKFLPKVVSKVKVKLLSIRQVQGHKAKAINIKVEVKGSNSEEIPVGEVYDLYLSMAGDQVQYTSRNIQAIMAAVCKKDFKDPKFLARPAMQERVNLGEDLAELNEEFIIEQLLRTNKETGEEQVGFPIYYATT